MNGAMASDIDPIAEHIVDGNRLTLLSGGEERLEAMIALIESANHRLDICYYIFAKDLCGERVVEAAIDACNRGVAVTMMIGMAEPALSQRQMLSPSSPGNMMSRTTRSTFSRPKT